MIICNWAQIETEVRKNGLWLCWFWQGRKWSDGYGRILNKLYAHRVFYQHYKGPIPKGLFVCHSCDVKHCVNPHHLFLDTAAGNSADMVRKGRQAKGDRNGSRLYPERLARGNKHYSQTNPEKLPWGDRNGARLYPGRRQGENNGRAKLKEMDIKEIFLLHSQGFSKEAISRQFKISSTAIRAILRKKIWKHVTTI